MTADTQDDHGAWVQGPRCVRPATGAGPLDGLRLAIKDLIDVEGCLTRAGNPDWAASQKPASADARAVATLRAAGAQVIGKTVTDELAFSLEGENAHDGTPRNPRAPGRLPGGSSSGSAVAVASGQADIALGTDTGGSVRVPSSFCGVWGMRPTHGRVPLQGVTPFAPSYDTVGWLAGTAHALALTGKALLQGDSLSRRPLRLRIASDALELAEPATARVLASAAAQLGIEERLAVFAGAWQPWGEAYAILQGLEIKASLGEWIKTRKPRFGANIAPRFEGALALREADGEPWRAWRRQAAQDLREALGDDEAWLVPAAPGPALSATASGEERGLFYLHALALGSLAGHAGLPQVVMPLAMVDGLPVGLSFISNCGNDERLLALAEAFESRMAQALR